MIARLIVWNVCGSYLRRDAVVEKGPWFRVNSWLLSAVCLRRGLVGPDLTGSETAPPELGPPRGRVHGLGWDDTTLSGACWRAAATGGDQAAWLP